MAGFICKNCNFRIKEGAAAKMCPNCGGARIEREKTAEELLADED